jgi:hypothetical protein
MDRSFRSVTAVVLLSYLCGVRAFAEENTIAARAARAAAARQKLVQSFSSGPVTGEFVERAVRNYVFVPAAPGLPQINVRNSSALSASAAGPLLDVDGTIDDRGVLNVTGYKLNSAPFLANDESLPDEVKAAGAALMATLNRALKPGAMSVSSQNLEDGSAIATETLGSIEQIRHAYAAALEAKNDKRAKAIAERWAEMRSQVTEVFPASEMYKALYGANDNYEPWRYALIYRQSAAVVAIGAPDSKTARCSGVLIADDLVLTAGHCFGGSDPRAPEELQVWFNYAKTSTGQLDESRMMRRRISELVSPPPARLPEMMDGAFGVNLLDYAIVRFARPAGQPLKPAEAEPQCLRNRHLNKGDAVYAVGFPRGDPMMVHDNARVYLPYVIRKGEQFVQLRLDTEADLLGSPQRAELMLEFDKSYELGVENHIEKYFLHHVKDGGQPRLGIVADTFRGNSGGPVYDRDHGQCVTGILLLGAPDTGVRRTVNWKEHERVVPISAILDDVHVAAPQIEAVLKKEQP